MSKLTTLYMSLKNDGLTMTLKAAIHGYFVVNKFIVFYRDLNLGLTSQTADDGIEIKQVSIAELQTLRNNGRALPPDFYCDRTYGFKTPCVALVDGKLAAIVWIVEPGEYSRFLKLEGSDAEYNYSFVLPAFRGKRLATLLTAYVIDLCQQRQLKRLFGVVSATNIPQFKQMIDMGFRPVEALTHFGLFRPKATLKYVK